MGTRALLVALLLAPVSLVQAADSPGSSWCRALELPETAAGKDRVYRLNDTVSFRIGFDPSLDTPTDYGARLMLLRKSSNAYSRSYHSKGAADSYGMRPAFIADCGGNELLIFGEIGTEYSWGLRVFAYNDGKVQALGEIPFAVEGESDAESAVPFMRFSRKSQSAMVSFTKDLIRNPGSPNETRIPRSAVRYQIDRNRLMEMPP